MAHKDTPQPEDMIALFDQVEDSDRFWKAANAYPSWDEMARQLLWPAIVFPAGLLWMTLVGSWFGWELQEILPLFLVGPLLMAAAMVWVLLIPRAMQRRQQRLRSLLTPGERQALDAMKAASAGRIDHG